MRYKTGEAEVGITFKVSRELAEHLRQLARQTALLERRTVSMASLVRAAVKQVYGPEMENDGNMAPTTAA